jgi:hypothetical protein
MDICIFLSPDFKFLHPHAHDKANNQSIKQVQYCRGKKLEKKKERKTEESESGKKNKNKGKGRRCPMFPRDHADTHSYTYIDLYIVTLPIN